MNIDSISSDILAQFGRKVQQLRKQKGWSQENLAEKTGLHRTYIGAIERGERNLSLKNIEKIAKAFEIPVADLFR